MARLRVIGAFLRSPLGIVLQGQVGEFDDDRARDYVRRGLAVYAEANDAPAEPAGGKPLADLKVDELRAYATERNIDLGDATKKADIVKAIEAAQADATSEFDDLDDDALMNLVIERGVEIAPDADRDALIAALNEGDE